MSFTTCRTQTVLVTSRQHRGKRGSDAAYLDTHPAKIVGATDSVHCARSRGFSDSRWQQVGQQPCHTAVDKAGANKAVV